MSTNEDKDYQEYQDYLAYLKHTNAAAIPEKPGMGDVALGALKTTGKVLDYIPGISRTLGQKAADIGTEGSAAGTLGKAAVGEAKPWGEYLKERGVPELGSIDVPLPNELAKEYFNADIPESAHLTGRGAIGAGMDVVSDPVVLGSLLAAPETAGASLGVGGARAASLLAKLGKAMKTATPVGALEAGLSGASKGSKLLGRTMAGMNEQEANQFVKSAPETYQMARDISNPETVGGVQRQASEILAPAIRDLGETAITPKMEKLQTLMGQTELPVDTSKLYGMLGHDPALDEQIKSILSKENPYGNLTTKPVIKAPATELNEIKRRGYQVADYKNNRSTAQLPTAKDAELAPLNNYLKQTVEEANPEIAGTNADIRRLINLRERANQLAGNPLNPFRTESLDQMSILGELAKESQSPALIQFRNQLKAAQSIAGKDAAKHMSGGYVKHGIVGALSKKGGRGLLRTEEAAPFSQMLNYANELPASKAAAQIPPEVWAKMMGANNGQNE